MEEVSLRNLRFLVADDFGNFRSTVNAMLVKMGILNIELVPSGEALIAACEKRSFDVILSDYDLGAGRNGQRVLEELRHRNLISRRTLFVLVSGNAAKDVVLASYDWEPDDYLAKPITGRLLEQRLLRLVALREALMPVYQALEKPDRVMAVALLTDLSIANNRHSLAAQKILGDLFLEQGDLDKAERLYGMALQVRPLDWARLGLAKIKQLRGEMEVAAQWMDQILTDNPLYLPAYDALANNLQERGQPKSEQATVARALEVSPMSILRQKRLAAVAEANGDIPTALKAWRHALKLGEYSCHAKAGDALQFARLAVYALETGKVVESQVSDEVIKALALAGDRFDLGPVQELQTAFLRGRLSALDGKLDAAQAQIDKAEARVLNDGIRDVDVDIERVRARQALGKGESADRLLQELLKNYAYDQEALEKLDHLLPEPVSESNREWVAAVNREGIDLYNQAQYDAALDCFERARKLFPVHVGIQLNMVQALIGKKRLSGLPPEEEKQLRDALKLIGSLVESDHSQYARYKRLRQMAYANASS